MPLVRVFSSFQSEENGIADELAAVEILSQAAFALVFIHAQVQASKLAQCFAAQERQTPMLFLPSEQLLASGDFEPTATVVAFDSAQCAVDITRIQAFDQETRDKDLKHLSALLKETFAEGVGSQHLCLVLTDVSTGAQLTTLSDLVDLIGHFVVLTGCTVSKIALLQPPNRVPKPHGTVIITISGAFEAQTLDHATANALPTLGVVTQTRANGLTVTEINGEKPQLFLQQNLSHLQEFAGHLLLVSQNGKMVQRIIRKMTQEGHICLRSPIARGAIIRCAAENESSFTCPNCRKRWQSRSEEGVIKLVFASSSRLSSALATLKPKNRSDCLQNLVGITTDTAMTQQGLSDHTIAGVLIPGEMITPRFPVDNVAHD